MQDAAVMVMLAPVLPPHGVLTLVRSLEADAALVLEIDRGVRLEQAFARRASGLRLGTLEPCKTQ
jgi:hypothetical protein